MDVLFLIFLDQICPKWIRLDLTWSNWISHKSKNVLKKSFHIYKKDKCGYLNLDFFDQICPKWIKLDQIRFLTNQKIVTIKSCHIYKKDSNGCFIILDFFGSDPSKVDQSWSNLIKLDQTWSNLIKLDQLDFSSIKKCCYKKLSHLQKG